MSVKEILTLIPADEARRILLATPPVGIETVALEEAPGRVLAMAVAAAHDLPSERRSAMDGYAVRAADVAGASQARPAVLAVAGAVPMGSVFGGRVDAGQAVAISTGGVIPDGADAVVMVEYTMPEGGGARVAVTRDLAAGANVVEVASDMRAGDPLLAAGRRLRPEDVAALAMFGVVRVPVFRRPRVAVFATGNELCPTHETPRPGQVRDVNQHALAAAVEAAGAVAVRAGIVPDDAEALRETVRRLVDAHDGVILSGGSSVGTKDLTAAVLGAVLAAPGILFHGIDIRPGKPTVFARAGGKPVVGMPGFPTSSLVVFEAFIRPMLARLAGESPVDPWAAPIPARLSKEQRKPAAREDYVRVRLASRAGEIWADPLPGGSAALSNVVLADGLVRLPAGLDHVPEGAIVQVRPI